MILQAVVSDRGGTAPSSFDSLIRADHFFCAQPSASALAFGKSLAMASEGYVCHDMYTYMCTYLGTEVN